MNFISEELELVPPGKRDFEEERFKKQAEQNFPYQNDPILQLVYVTFSTDTEKEIVEMELSEHECYFQVLKKADEMFPLVWTEMVFEQTVIF
ncbi:Protein CBG26703 [Caenorhabditis briggsae]|uniref:Protein CBG26703 n=1 Tax=Caenorhabditis briggsae TaxID=6238 RepID=B6IE73_CAEBR|nr:Protein CBG26703 [Caenorhabditis briggsae]CAS01137.1 Protein CBG26703 [Caenorhabditis briggsae]